MVCLVRDSGSALWMPVRDHVPKTSALAVVRSCAVVPFQAALANNLPVTGQVGDFFVAFHPPVQDPASGVTVSVALFVCLGVSSTKLPWWFKVAASPVDEMGKPFFGGTQVR